MLDLPLTSRSIPSRDDSQRCKFVLLISNSSEEENRHSITIETLQDGSKLESCSNFAAKMVKRVGFVGTKRSAATLEVSFCHFRLPNHFFASGLTLIVLKFDMLHIKRPF